MAFPVFNDGDVSDSSASEDEGIELSGGIDPSFSFEGGVDPVKPWDYSGMVSSAHRAFKPVMLIPNVYILHVKEGKTASDFIAQRLKEKENGRQKRKVS